MIDWFPFIDGQGLKITRMLCKRFMTVPSYQYRICVTYLALLPIE